MPGYEKDKPAVQTRLRRIEGQLRGPQKSRRGLTDAVARFLQA
jgi:DNA-binding FrmR family transcriptional regulator